MDARDAALAARHALGQHLRTDNMLLDVVVSVVLCALLSAAMSVLDARYLERMFRRIVGAAGRGCTVSLRCSQATWHGRTTTACSPEFTAILACVRDATSNGLARGVRHLVELPAPRGAPRARTEPGAGQEPSGPQTLYLVDQRAWFTLDAYPGVRLRMYSEVLNARPGQHHDASGDCRTHTLEVSSSSLGPDALQRFVSDTTAAYRAAAAARDNADLHVFSYEGLDDCGEAAFSVYPFETTCTLSSLHFDGKERLFREIDAFDAGRADYERKGRPHTLGICTHGPPGCGKTTFEKVLCKHLGRHMIIVDAGVFRTQEELDELFFSPKLAGRTVPYAKRLYVFPDIDRTGSVALREMFRKPDVAAATSAVTGAAAATAAAATATAAAVPGPTATSRSRGAPLTLSKVLNVLDGVPERTGQIVVMSANHPERLDPALLRPGRIDKVVHFNRATAETVSNIVESYFGERPEGLGASVERVMTPAEVIKCCTEARSANEAVQLVERGPPASL